MLCTLNVQHGYIDMADAHRYVKGSGDRRIGTLLPQMLKSSQLAKVAVYEPVWLADCKVELNAWAAVYKELNTLVPLIAGMEAHLEGVPTISSCIGAVMAFLSLRL